MTLYDNMNERQKEAMLCTEGPLLIIAGAGSGKTRVLTHRIAWLIESGITDPWHILAITFTNKAAGEMRQRVDSLVGEGADQVWVATFHSTCVRILRRFIDRIGYENGFTIYDADDQKTLMKQVFKDCFISGTVDFIFGCGDALFENCEIRSRLDARGGGYVSAPAHALEQTVGFVFNNCRLTCDEGVKEESIFLGRPWRDYGLTSFINCTYGKHIKAVGFNKWDGTERDKTSRFYEDDKPEGRVEWSKRVSKEDIKRLLEYFN